MTSNSKMGSFLKKSEEQLPHITHTQNLQTTWEFACIVPYSLSVLGTTSGKKPVALGELVASDRY